MIRTCLLAMMIAVQASDILRFVYVWLELAPDCPVVGRDHSSDCGIGIAKPITSQVVYQESRSDQPRKSSIPSPNDKSEECPTCHMLAVIETFTPPVTQTVLSHPTRITPLCRLRHANPVIYVIQTFRSRAPPITDETGPVA